MNLNAGQRLLLVWLGLSVISVLQLWLGAGGGEAVPTPSAVITFGVIGMALVKVRFIVREFMEVRHAPALLGRLTDAWLALTAVALLGTYVAGMALNG